MPLFRARIGLPGGGESAHDHAGLQGDFEVDFGTIGDAADRSVEFAADGQHAVAEFFRSQASRSERGVRGAFRV